MSAAWHASEQSSPITSPPSSQSRKPQRVLACVLCQQRKIKCNRKFPCANCIRSKASCVPATLNPRRRKRRFPERELLDRLSKYEDLLRQNNVKFEPLHQDPVGEDTSPNIDDTGHSDEEVVKQPSRSPESKPERTYEAKYVQETKPSPDN